MYELIRTLGIHDVVVRQLPIVATSLLIAELFYKFHSFVLECAAFLVTWFVFDGIVHAARSLRHR